VSGVKGGLWRVVQEIRFSSSLKRRSVLIVPDVMYDPSMSLKRSLAGVIPDDKISLLSDRYEVIGDLAVLDIPAGLEAYQDDIALALISKRKNIRTVLRKSGKIEGAGRLAAFEVLIGSNTITEHHECGYRYRMDVAKVFFNSRLGTERMRVAAQVRPGERVLVPFCGVGPFVVPAAARGASVVAVDQNPDAIRWLFQNLVLNRVFGQVRAVRDDAFRIPRFVEPGFDRVIVPTPYGSDRILTILTGMTKKGGNIHFYTFKPEDEIGSLMESFGDNGLTCTASHKCGSVAPGICRYVFDLVKE
jgi:tRNA (guanine37-N1)-methyltransferase